MKARDKAIISLLEERNWTRNIPNQVINWTVMTADFFYKKLLWYKQQKYIDWLDKRIVILLKVQNAFRCKTSKIWENWNISKPEFGKKRLGRPYPWIFSVLIGLLIRTDYMKYKVARPKEVKNIWQRSKSCVIKCKRINE